MQRRREEEEAKLRSNQEKLDKDLNIIRQAKLRGCDFFLRYINDNYVPNNKKIQITDEMLEPQKIKHTMKTKFSLVFHPDKNVSQPQHIQIICEEIMQIINFFIAQYQ